jgi:hypothetical protein
MRRPPVAVSAVGRVERRQIELANRIDHEPREVIVR